MGQLMGQGIRSTTDNTNTEQMQLKSATTTMFKNNTTTTTTTSSTITAKKNATTITTTSSISLKVATATTANATTTITTSTSWLQDDTTTNTPENTLNSTAIALPLAMVRDDDPQPEILPLLPWELETAFHRTCHPPSPDFPNYCCLGSISRGGSLFYNPNVCNNPSIYHRVGNYTQQYLLQKTQTSRRKTSGRLCDVCQIVDHLIANNWTLTFQGDSMTRQTFAGLECELRRRGYNVQTFVKDYPERTDTFDWSYGIKAFSQLLITPPPPLTDKENNSDSKLSASSPAVAARIQMYAMYRPVEDNVEIYEIVNNSDVLIFDHGLHWLPREKMLFRNAMYTLLQGYYNHTKHLKLLAWRETSSQHYNRPGGHFISGAQKEPCTEMNKTNETDWKGWRLPIVQDVSKRVGFQVRNVFDDFDFLHQPKELDKKELVILPFRDYTSELHYLHPGECAHYCSNPYVWLPIWRTLRLAMDRV